MSDRFLAGLAAGGLLLAGCSAEPAADGNDSAANAANASPAPGGNAAASTDRSRPAPVYTLSGNGLEPGLSFGTPREQVVAAVTEAFGPPTGTEHNSECGEGPMDFVNFGGLSLGFQDGRFAGWSLYERMPALRTAGGLAVGAPRSALGDAPIDRESTLGPEFHIGEISGLLDEGGREVAALWAGQPCQFR